MVDIIVETRIFRGRASPGTGGYKFPEFHSEGSNDGMLVSSPLSCPMDEYEIPP